MTNSFKPQGGIPNNALMQGVWTVQALDEVHAYIQFEYIIPNELQLGVALFGLALSVVEPVPDIRVTGRVWSSCFTRLPGLIVIRGVQIA